MAQQKFSINLQDVSFPMLSHEMARTVIIANKGEVQASPSIIYCENVIPTEAGYASAGYIPTVPASDSIPAMVAIKEMFGSLRGRLYLGVNSDGNTRALIDGSFTWSGALTGGPVTAPGFDPDAITIATVNGVSYAFYKVPTTPDAYIYDEGTNALVAAGLTGLSLPDVLGVVGSSGYLIAYTEGAVAWSSTIDPTDFVPSSVTGAGGGNIAEIKGPIRFCTSNSTGFIIHTDENAVSATYTGNVQYPFKFKEVTNSKGLDSLNRIAFEANTDTQYVYSNAGLQTITAREANTVLPPVTEFLSGHIQEAYNTTTGQFSSDPNISYTSWAIALTYISSRYLFISYGIAANTYEYVLVIDLVSKRVGKLKVSHAHCFEYTRAGDLPTAYAGFMDSTGAISVLDMSSASASTGVLILGKLQGTHTKLVTLEGLSVQNKGRSPVVPNALDFLNVATLASLDGATHTLIPATLVYDSQVTNGQSYGNVVDYAFRATALQHSIVLHGYFDLRTVLATYHPAGRR